MARIVIPRPRRSTQRFYRPGAKLDPSMKGKFGAAELQFLTKAIDTAIAVGGKVIGAVERSQMDKGATSDAVAAAARSEGGLGGQKAMDAVSRAQAAADELGAGALAPGPAAFAADQGASLASTPVATEEVAAVQEVGRPIVAMGAAPERAAAIARMEEARADFAAEPELVPAGLHGKAYTGLTPQERIPGPTQAHQQAALSDALGRAQALVFHAKETGDARHLDPARKLYDGIIESGALTVEQHAAVIDSEPFNAAFSAEWWGAPSPTAPVAAGPAPMAQAATAPVAQQVAQAAPQQQVVGSAEEALFRQWRQLDERERRRAEAFLPQNLRGMRPGQLRAVLRFAKTPQEAAAVMGAIRRAPEVQPMGLGDVLGGGHIDRAQEVKGWKPPSVKAPPSEFEQTMKLQRHNAWLRESQARAKSSGALTDQRRAAIKAAQDKADAKLARSSRRRGVGTDKGILDNLRAHRRFSQARQEGSGIFSNDRIAARLNEKRGASMQYEPAEIEAERRALWARITGPLANDDSTSVELHARSLLKSKRSRKDASDTADDIAKAVREARIAEHGAQRQGLAEQRAANIELSKARQWRLSVQRLLSSAEARAAKAKFGEDVLGGMDEADAVAIYSNKLDEIARAVGQSATPEQAPLPAGTPVFDATSGTYE